MSRQGKIAWAGYILLGIGIYWPDSGAYQTLLDTAPYWCAHVGVGLIGHAFMTLAPK